MIMVLITQKKDICNCNYILYTGKMKKYFPLILILNFPFSGIAADENEYIFDPSLFKGGHFDLASLEMLSKPGAVPPGDYKLDIYVNQVFIGKYDVSYQVINDNSVPCFSPELINDIGFKNGDDIIRNSNKKCFFLSDISSLAEEKTELSALKLNISVPQALLNIKPRGYVNPDNYDSGENIGFINYLVNYYHISYSNENTDNFDSGWLSVNGGVNFGALQYRQVSNVAWNKNDGYTWNNISSYIQRPLVTIMSQFMAGQLVTNGRFFSGMSYNGINLSTADAMLPDSVRGYAPVIRGIASSNAKVVVRQNGQEIYQTTVPPGNFEINDLYPTSYNGDLQVQVTEADGTVKTFVVPFSAVPESMRPGMSRYNLAVGRTRNTQKKSAFADITYQRGLTNSITANGGVRVAEDYVATVFGGVYTSTFGAFGLNTTFSRAKLPGNTSAEGWMTQASWSKTFEPAGTTVSLATYRYSTSGYRELTEILGTRSNSQTGADWLNYTSGQRSRFDITLSQSLGDYGNIFITGATQNYRDGRSRDTQLQLGYSQTFNNGISMNASLARQRTGNYDNVGTMETATAISFSVPFSLNSPRSVSLSASYNYSKSSGEQYQTSASGMMDDAQTISYNLNATHDKKYAQTTLGGSLQKRLPDVNIGMNASTGKGYWQVSGNAQGALAVHSGGLTFGPYLGDTFALVEAKGAEGAKLFTSSQTHIDSNGYALVPSVTPYRYNNISIDPQGMKGNVEVLDSQKRVAPIAGSGVKVKFRTRTGAALLIKTITDSGMTIPMGAQVYDSQDQLVGITGQGGQIYVRVEQHEGVLTARWGNGNAYCALPYKIKENDINQPLINMTVHCNNSSKGM